MRARRGSHSTQVNPALPNSKNHCCAAVLVLIRRSPTRAYRAYCIFVPRFISALPASPAYGAGGVPVLTGAPPCPPHYPHQDLCMVCCCKQHDCLRAALQSPSAIATATDGLRSDPQALQLLAELATWLQQYACSELYCLPDDGASSDSLQGLGYMAVLLLADSMFTSRRLCQRTDDGCGIVCRSSGMPFQLTDQLTGQDLGCNLLCALHPDLLRSSSARSNHAIPLDSIACIDYPCTNGGMLAEAWLPGLIMYEFATCIIRASTYLERQT